PTRPGYGPPPYPGPDQPGPGPQWATPSPPAGGGGKTGWIAGGVAVVVIALIITVAAVAVVTRDGSGGDQAAGDAAIPVDIPSPADVPLPAPPNAYTSQENICGEMDISSVEDLAGTRNILYDEGYQMFSVRTWVCKYSMRNDDVWGHLDLTVNVHPDINGATREFGRGADVARSFFDRVEEAPGSWQQGRVLVREESTGQSGSTTVLYQIQDSNL